MKTIVLATNNKHKLKEFKEILTEYNIITLNDIDFLDEIEENGETFEENALIKAKTVHMYLKEKGLEYTVVAEDSGLCVNSLNGAPGIYSARYSGIHSNDQTNRDKIQKELEGKNRDAYFICTIVEYYPNGEYKTFVGKTFGEISKQELGSKEFGYDCIFFSKDLNKTFGEATEEEKNSVSHRSRAIHEMLKDNIMKLGIEEAKRTMNQNIGGPFGAVIVKDKKVISIASNTVLKSNDPTAHAEINAIRKASQTLESYDLKGCELYATGYPCPMCLSAIMWANIKDVYYGTELSDAESIGFRDDFIYEFIRNNNNGETLKLQNIDRDECVKLFKQYNQSGKKIY